MALDVETPDPPALRGPQDPGDYDAVDEFARTVSEALENDYSHRGGDEFGYDWE